MGYHSHSYEIWITLIYQGIQADLQFNVFKTKKAYEFLTSIKSRTMPIMLSLNDGSYGSTF